MATITQATIWNELQTSLEGIVDDVKTSYRPKLDFPKWMSEKNFNSAYIDFQELGGPGYAAEVEETTEIPEGSIAEGYSKRFRARKFGRLLAISREAREDNKYAEALELDRRLNKSVWKTADLDATFTLSRATDANYPGPDGVVLASASHTLPQGGTYTNLLTGAIAPSVAAVAAARTQARRQVGHDGIVEGYDLEKVVFPDDQWEVWESIVGSPQDPEPGNSSKINVVKKMNLDLVPVKLWTNTTTNYTFLTSCEDQPAFYWRRKPSSDTWPEKGVQIMMHSITARWDCGYTDPRAFIYSQA
jgi:hypothetical protein